jgi:mono/diheme cytochrome c family protein
MKKSWLLASCLQILSAATAAHAQTSLSAGSSSTPADVSKTIQVVFHDNCRKCHGEDGTGTPARQLMPGIPNFTKADWQRRRTNAQLQASILEGKGDGMPAFRSKISSTEAKSLAELVRKFVQKKKGGAEESSVPDLEEEFQRLQEEFCALQREARKLREKASRPDWFCFD